MIKHEPLNEVTAAAAVTKLFQQARDCIRRARQTAEAAGLYFEDYCQSTLLAMYEDEPVGFVIYEGGPHAQRYAARWNDESNGESTLVQVVPCPHEGN
jgi:hypothetical protein